MQSRLNVSTPGQDNEAQRACVERRCPSRAHPVWWGVRLRLPLQGDRRRLSGSGARTDRAFSDLLRVNNYTPDVIVETAQSFDLVEMKKENARESMDVPRKDAAAHQLRAAAS